MVTMCNIDGIIIATETIDGHLLRLQEFFDCIHAAGFKCKLAKCDFTKAEATYLGRAINSQWRVLLQHFFFE